MTTESNTQHDLAVQARLQRLSQYRAMQLRLQHERRQQVSRRRLLELHGNIPWGWLAL